ncbi:MAG TPA: hypothetical protein VN797_09390 [Gemmatimonadaceae bacterium]|nr:hypothetical protein [Gemmatimonadaceae bacterium]
MSRGKDDAELVGREHHSHSGVGELRKHLGVPGKIVAPRQKRSFVDRSSDDTIDLSGRRHGDRALDGEAADLPSHGGRRAGRPRSDRLPHRHACSGGTNHYNVTALADLWVSERLSNDLGSNPAGISHGHGKT